MKNVKIRLIAESEVLWLKVNYFRKRRGSLIRLVDNFYLVESSRSATAVPLVEALKWMSEAKTLARFDGVNPVKGEYVIDGKAVTLKQLGLQPRNKNV